MVDGDFVTNESRAAAAYLVNKHGGEKKNQIYPESPEDRAKVDQRMYFDMGTFYKAFGECVVCTVTILFIIIFSPCRSKLGVNHLINFKSKQTILSHAP